MPQFGEPGERIGYKDFSGAPNLPPILLIHGFTASSASFHSNIGDLREHFRVITVDLLGHGDSDSPADAGPYLPDAAIGRITGLLDHLEIERALICGHSLGGAVALRLALDAPHRVAGLVIINSNSAAGSAQWREEVQPRLAEMAARLRAEGTDFLRSSRIYPAASSRLPADARSRLIADFAALEPQGVAGTAEGLVARVNVIERTPELTVPTLVLVGTRDTDFVTNVPRLIAGMPPSLVQVVDIEDAGHAANLEKPEEFHRELLRFARETGHLPSPAPAKTGPGRQTALLGLGGAFVVVGVGLLAAAFLTDRDGADVLPPATATPRQQVAGARTTATPSATGTSASVTARAAVSQATPTATRAPNTPTPPANTATPADEPTQQPTPAPPATPTPTPTPTATPPPRAPSSPSLAPPPSRARAHTR